MFVINKQNHTLDKNECDFVVMKRSIKPLAIQVCYSLAPDNLERELAGLYQAMRVLKIKEGTIVTLNQKDKFTTNGLTAHVVPAYEYLSGKQI